ncbi:MAG: putative transposase [Candidatus Krumholzibacteriia bacterium]
MTMNFVSTNRRLDRIMAYLGFLNNLAALFHSDTRVPSACVLLSLPALVQSGVLGWAREISVSMGSVFYGLQTTIFALLLTALLHIPIPWRWRVFSKPLLPVFWLRTREHPSRKCNGDYAVTVMVNMPHQVLTVRWSGADEGAIKPIDIVCTVR